jgi:hypothetical protein
VRARAMAAAATAAAMMVIAAGPAAAIQAGPPSGARSQLDARAGERTPVPSAVRDARHALAERLGIESHVAVDPVGGGIRVLDRTNGFLSGPQAGDAATVALDWVRAHADVFGLGGAEIAALHLVDRTTSNDGVTHLTWVPESDGVPAYDGELRVHLARDGRVIAASGPPLGGLSLPSATPRLTASQALAAAQSDVGAPAALPRATTRPGPEQRTTFANGASARLVAFQAPSGDRLAWRVTVAGKDPYWFDEVIDAGGGQVLARRSLTRFVSNALVYDYYPGAPSATHDGGTAHPVDISRWLSPSATTLTGPDAHAYADVNDNDRADSGEEIGPSGGSDWLYPITPFFQGGCTNCTWDDADVTTESTNRSQATTQVFYFVNNFHDWLAQPSIGFTTSAGGSSGGNFEGADPVLAEADDSSRAASPHFNNANMTTFPDGTSPRMQMYLFGFGLPDVNGADDASVVYHEYTHGLSNRLIDNANGLSENQGGAMGEGWSDWYAMDYLVANGFVDDTSADGEVRVAEYVTGDTVHGIRHQALDCAVGSSDPACPGSTFAGHGGGFTYADLGRVGGDGPRTPSFEVHDDGEIWSETLWDLRTALGAPTARRLVTDAMRLSPANPSYLDERDAILLADLADFGGSERDAIWQVLANRGMGYGARTTSPNATRGLASFAVPTLAEVAGTSVADAAAADNGNGVADPGELLSVSVPLTNPGLGTLTGVQATLLATTSGVTVPVATASYGTLGAGATVAGAAPFSVQLPATLACGAQATFTLHVTSGQGAVDLPVTLTTGSGRGTFASVDVPKAIPDDQPTSMSAVSALTIPTGGRIDRLRVTLDVTHTFVGDLRARLTAPSGQTIDLLERPGSSFYGSSGLGWSGPVTFDDGAAASIQELPDGPGMLAGSFVPDEPLAALAGQDRAGAWSLRMTDGAQFDVGTLNGWSIETEQPACAPLPTPPAVTPPAPRPRRVAAPTHVTRRATLDRRHRFAFLFRATPGLRGSIRFAIPKRGRVKAIAFGKRSFTVPRSGRVKLVTKVSGKALTQLRRRHRIRVRVTLVLGGRTFRYTLTLVLPTPRRHRR